MMNNYKATYLLAQILKVAFSPDDEITCNIYEQEAQKHFANLKKTLDMDKFNPCLMISMQCADIIKQITESDECTIKMCEALEALLDIKPIDRFRIMQDLNIPSHFISNSGQPLVTASCEGWKEYLSYLESCQAVEENL